MRVGDPYRPIDCGVHDRLEALAVLRRTVTVEWVGEDGTAASGTVGRILDIQVAEGAEWLILEGGERIRLDRLVRVAEDSVEALSLPRAAGEAPPEG